jgi:formylglycine-generating enzyme required for sulfatase activity/ABC-type iron transport system FetAB ATPase subunit
VYDVFRDAGRVVVVQKYIAGHDLDAEIDRGRLDPEQCVKLMSVICDALAFAHRKDFIHRDLKPGNILLDEQGRPYIADFGLAIHESAQRRLRGQRSGSLPYMSPEQVRGEVNRLDGRSDLWSMGVILYEMLTQRRPFGGNEYELVDEITHRDPRPLRMIDGQIPAELERICLKCLTKRATDRYSSAVDLADDLRHWLAGDQEPKAAAPAVTEKPKVVPKGLRSFGEEDADFFLDLLPGPRGRDGLPESIRFWKTRIEETDPDKTFSVGLIYGPSGCGKSSLVKAGLLPRLASHVIPIYVEATPADTEVRLLKVLRKACHGIPAEISLPELFASLRDGLWVPRGKKLAVVLDQFEQWLHAHRSEEGTQLVRALRHCDGGRVQCVLMVRDDFWMPVTRLLADLEVDLVQGQNAAAIDRFDLAHAERVLTYFGRAYGSLPDETTELSGEQREFLERAVTGLSEAGKIVCVRLALFADMAKGRPWTPRTLEQLGGVEGIGVVFLEETFSSEIANPRHRLHQKAARSVLTALIPQSGANIKAPMRPYEDLLDASGYASRPKDFAELMRILDGETRLVTPTDPEARSSEDGHPGAVQGEPGKRYYQLTHDYLVPSLREWLTRKQRETRRGRAGLWLEERAATWNAKPENRYLPSLWEYLNIRTLTNARRWTDSQRTMMYQATRFHGVRSALGAVALVALVAIGMVVRTNIAKQQEATRIRGLVGELENADPAQLLDIVKELDANPAMAATYLSPLLSQQNETLTPDDKRARLHARLATVSRDPSLVEPLVEELLNGKVTYVLPIRQLLRPSSATLTEKFRSLLRDENADAQRRFRAALALADYVPSSEAASWSDQDLKFVAAQLVSSNAEFQPLLRDALRPIREQLFGNLERIFGDAKATHAQRLGAANTFADYSTSDIARLSRLLTVATPEQYAVLYPLVAANPTPGTIDGLTKIAATLPPEGMGSVERIPYGQRRANAAVTLLRLGEREKVLPVFEMTDDPEALTQSVFRCRPRGVGVDALLDCLQLVSDAPPDRYPKNTRYALLLALGEFTLEETPTLRRESLLKQLADWYANDPSSGVHGAAGWLLRQWGQIDVATRIDQTEVPYSAGREWFTLAITVTPTPPPKPREKPGQENSGTESEPAKPDESTQSTPDETAKTDASTDPTAPAEKTKPEPSVEPLPPKTFYYTFIVFPAGEYAMGSVPDEPDRQKYEVRHPVKLTRPFALLEREITFEELIAFSPQYVGFMQQFYAKPADAVFGANWYDSVGYCRWLGAQSGLAELDQPYAAPESLDKEKYPREPNPQANWAPRDWPVDMSRRGFRLPTEAEWEIAARGGVRTAYSCGSDVGLLGRYGWFAENSGKHVHPPKELRPSVRGLFDLHGNLYEWTHDWYGDYATEATDPLGRKRGSIRVLRGGGWGYDAAICRAASRITIVPTDRTVNIGFRLALSPSGVSPEAGEDK